MTLVWFAPLVEHKSLSLNGFETFIQEFKETFGDLHSEHTSITKL
jgi:hypothetical protein